METMNLSPLPLQDTGIQLYVAEQIHLLATQERTPPITIPVHVTAFRFPPPLPLVLPEMIFSNMRSNCSISTRLFFSTPCRSNCSRTGKKSDTFGWPYTSAKPSWLGFGYVSGAVYSRSLSSPMDEHLDSGLLGRMNDSDINESRWRYLLHAS